jgi:hypothetical protein
MAKEYRQYKDAFEKARDANIRYSEEARKRSPKKIPSEQRPGEIPVGPGVKFYPTDHGALAPLAAAAGKAAEEYAHIA